MFIGIALCLDAYLVVSCLGAYFETAPVFFWLLFFAFQVLFSSQVWLYFVFFKSEATEKIRFENALRSFAFHGMGVISFLSCFTIIRDFLALLFLAFQSAHLLYGAIPSSCILFLTFLAYCIGAWNAKFRIESPKVEITLPSLPASLEGVRIAQLSDMHLGTGPRPTQIKRLVDQTLSLKPDLIVLTGDIFDGQIEEIGPEISELARLRAEHGVYFVLGNHECYWDWKACVATVENLGFIPLLNVGVSVNIRGKSIYIAGLTDPAAPHAGGEAPQIPMPPSISSFNLMLVHQPQFATKVAAYPYHLQLSGHTHGGQFFPWNLAVKKMYSISGGLGREKNLWVYVSHGSGYWGPPLRLGTQGEVTELILKRE